MADRDEYTYMAKLAEQAEKYDGKSWTIAWVKFRIIKLALLVTVVLYSPRAPTVSY